jgi:hypothetical protein
MDRERRGSPSSPENCIPRKAGPVPAVAEPANIGLLLSVDMVVVVCNRDEAADLAANR